LEVPESNVGSYAWRSILKGRDVLLKDARWRVGNGETIGVWLDAWLSSHEHPRILTPMVVGFKEARVADLIDPSTRQWDSNMLQGLFTPNEVELIKSIPLCSSSMEDKMAWPYPSLGQYIVQSGYRFLTIEDSSNHSIVRSNLNVGVWKLIWGLSIPNKVKNFLWRSCQDALPVKVNLKR